MEEMRRSPSAELAEEAKEEYLTSPPPEEVKPRSLSTSSGSSSEESWTILNEEDAKEAEQSSKELEVAAADSGVASSTSLVTQAGEEDATDSVQQQESESESIEALDKIEVETEPPQDGGVVNLLACLAGFGQQQQISKLLQYVFDYVSAKLMIMYCSDDGTESLPGSVNSDGIPIEDEYKDDQGEEEESPCVSEQHYHWDADIPKEESKDDDNDVSSECDVSEDADDIAEDDLEMLPPLSPAPAALAAQQMANDVSTGYPDEELPEEFAEAKVRNEDNTFHVYFLLTKVSSESTLPRYFSPSEVSFAFFSIHSSISSMTSGGRFLISTSKRKLRMSILVLPLASEHKNSFH